MKDPMKESADNLRPYDIEESFPMLLTTCVKYMREKLKECFTKAGYKVTHEQWTILLYLAQQDGISQQDLADRFERSKVSAFNLLKKLEQKGLVLRKTDPVDARYNRVYLTAEGRKLQNTLTPLARANSAAISAGISVEEIETLKAVVRKLNANMKG